MQIFSNIPLDMTNAVSTVPWFKSIPNEHRTVAVFNKLARTALNLGSADPPNAALEFSGQIGAVEHTTQQRLIIYEDDPLDTRKVGLFLAKNESVFVISGVPLYISDLPQIDTLKQGNFGQFAVVEDGAILALNCSAETPEEAPEYWQFDSALGGWSLVEPWSAGVDILML